MSPALKNGILLAALVIILALTGFFFTRGKKETVYPSDGPMTEWICDKCGKHFELSPAQYKAWADSPDKVRRDPNLGNQTVFWCDVCQAYTVVRAKVDPRTGKWYFTRDSQGRPVPPPEVSESEEPPKKEQQ